MIYYPKIGDNWYIHYIYLRMGNLLGGEKNKDSEPKKVNRESQR